MEITLNMKLLGRKLIIKLNGVAIAGAKSCEIDIQCDSLEVASDSQQEWREFIKGRKEWSVSCGHLIPATGTPMKSDADMVGTTVTVTMQTGLSGDTLTGQAIVRQWRATAAEGALANGSFAFRGSGPLA